VLIQSFHENLSVKKLRNQSILTQVMTKKRGCLLKQCTLLIYYYAENASFVTLHTITFALFFLLSKS